MQRLSVALKVLDMLEQLFMRTVQTMVRLSAYADPTCDMIQMGSSVSRRTPTRRIPTARPLRACWRPTSRACGPSSSTAPPTLLPSSTRWLGKSRTTQETVACYAETGQSFQRFARNYLTHKARKNKWMYVCCFICTCHPLIIGSQMSLRH